MTNKNTPKKIVHDDGNIEYVLNGEYHRLDGPAVEWPDGSKEWFRNGLLHRDDGPAFESVYGYKAWYLNDEKHRLDGPALEHPDGTKEWWIDGKEYTFQYFIQYAEKNQILTVDEIKQLQSEYFLETI